MTHLTPRQIVAELDRYIVGQSDAKRAVAVAIRNRIRRYMDRFGVEEVETFIDACLSIEDLIDIHSPFVKRFDQDRKSVV